MKTSVERIKYLIENKNVTPYQISNLTGVSESTLSRLLNNESNKPSKKTITKLANYFQVSEKWLESGIGEMNESSKKEVKSEVSPVPYDNYMVVEYADLSTAAGKLGVENPAILPEMKKRLVPKEFDNGNYLVVKVDGDSMDNGTNISIPDGTEILIKEYYLNNGDKLPIRNNLFVIVSKTGTVFKQISEHNTEEGYIICHSYNSKYKDFKIEMNEVIQIFIYRKIVSFRPSIPEI